MAFVDDHDKAVSGELPDWLSIIQALIWVRYREPSLLFRRERSIDRPIVGPPSVGDWKYSDANSDHLSGLTFDEKRRVVAKVGDLRRVLEAGSLAAHGRKKGELFRPIEPIQWTLLDIAPRDLRRQEPYQEIRIARDDLIKFFPPVEMARPSEADLVAWCQRWIDSGKGNGMDKAWLAFQAEPKHAGLSRDDAFRPAWRAAKGKKAG